MACMTPHPDEPRLFGGQSAKHTTAQRRGMRSGRQGCRRAVLREKFATLRKEFALKTWKQAIVYLCAFCKLPCRKRERVVGVIFQEHTHPTLFIPPSRLDTRKLSGREVMKTSYPGLHCWDSHASS